MTFNYSAKYIENDKFVGHNSQKKFDVYLVDIATAKTTVRSFISCV